MFLESVFCINIRPRIGADQFLRDLRNRAFASGQYLRFDSWKPSSVWSVVIIGM